MVSRRPTGKCQVIDSRRQAYLDAMGITVWSLRDTTKPGNAVGLNLGPGSGSLLLVCAVDMDSASKLANDIVRSLGSVPVWSWPAETAESVSLEDAVSDHLFTTIAIFGSALAERFFGDTVPDSLGSANLVVLPAMEDLDNQADARRLLWGILCQTGIVTVT